MKSRPGKNISKFRTRDSFECTVKTEWGYSKLIFSKKGLVALSFPEFRRRNPKSFCPEYAGCKNICDQLKKYFKGVRMKFDCKINFDIFRPFERRVFKSIFRVPYGKVISYGQAAINIGNKNASRAVGNALSKNPIPIIIPCHRIIHKDGTPGGFSAGMALKKKLLKSESIRLIK